MNRGSYYRFLSVVILAVLLGCSWSAFANSSLPANLNLAETQIVWWSTDNSPVLPFAASELQRYVSQITGITVQTKQVQAPYLPDGTLLPRGLFIGDGSSAVLTSEWGNATLVEHVGQEAGFTDDYTIHPTERGILLTGVSPRSVLYAGYHLLELWGTRFFAPAYFYYKGQNEYVPKNSTLRIPTGDIKEQSAFQFRKKYIEEGLTHTGENLIQLVDWMAKNRMNVLVSPMDYQGKGQVRWDKYIADGRLLQAMEQRGVVAEVGGHGYQSFLPYTKYPTFYEPGKTFPCMSNSTALETYIRNVQGYLTQHPEIGIFDAWPPDGNSWCTQDNQTYGSPKETQAQVVTKLSTTLAASHPNVIVEFLAYLNYQEPTTTVMPKNLLVDYAEYDRSYSEPIFTDSVGSKNRVFNLSLQNWMNSPTFTGPISLYTYYRKYSWRSHPAVLFDLISEEIPYYYSLGVTGMGSYSEPGDWLTYELTHYLIARLSWNPRLNSDELLTDYLDKRYGVSAVLMRDYFRSVEEAGRSLFDSPSGALDPAANDANALRKALLSYQRAQSIIVQSKQLVTDNPTAQFFLNRLGFNLDYAMNDTLFSLSHVEGNVSSAFGAGLKASTLISSHLLDGIIVDRGLATRYASLPKKR